MSTEMAKEPNIMCIKWDNQDYRMSFSYDKMSGEAWFTLPKYSVSNISHQTRYRYISTIEKSLAIDDEVETTKRIIKAVFLGKKPALYSYWIFKNHNLVHADPHSCYKVLTCNKFVKKFGPAGVE